jgi:hypothetical protein
MSDDFGGWADMVVPGGGGSISQPMSSIAPDWSGGLYAPINYTPASSAYSPIPTTVGNGDHAAQDLNARVIREQYADYERRFQPFENLAISLLTPTGTKDLPYDIARTKEVIGGVFGSLQGQQQRAMERFGQVNKADNITGSNAEAGAMVGGLNMAVFADEARRMKLLGGGSSSAATVVRGTGGSS